MKKTFIFGLIASFSFVVGDAVSVSDNELVGDVIPLKSLVAIDNEDNRNKVDRLNDELMNNFLPMVERVLVVRIPREKILDAKPSLGFKVGPNFYNEGLPVLSLIEILEQNDDLLICRQFLEKLDEIFFLQFRLLIRKLKFTSSITRNDWIQFGVDFQDDSDVSARGSLLGYSDEYVQMRVIDVLSRFYDPALKDAGFILGVLRKAYISVFRARAASAAELTEIEQKDFLISMLDSLSRSVGLHYDKVINDSRSAILLPSKNELLGSFKALGIAAIEKRVQVPWRSIFKAAVITLGVAGAVYFIWYLINRWEQSMANIKDAPKNVPKPFIDFVKRMNNGTEGEWTKVARGAVERGAAGKGQIGVDIDLSDNTERLVEQFANRMEAGRPPIEAGLDEPTLDLGRNLVTVVNGAAEKFEKSVDEAAEVIKDAKKDIKEIVGGIAQRGEVVVDKTIKVYEDAKWTGIGAAGGAGAGFLIAGPAGGLIGGAVGGGGAKWAKDKFSGWWNKEPDEYYEDDEFFGEVDHPEHVSGDVTEENPEE